MRTARRCPPAPWLRSWPAIGVLIALALVALAMAIPPVFGWQINALGLAPLHSVWRPRFGPGTVPSVAIGLATLAWAPRLADRLTWPGLLATSVAAGTGWMVALATVDGRSGLGSILATPDEYLRTARRVTNVSSTLHHFISRIPATGAHPWSIHVAGHPPGALLFFVALTRIGLGSDLGAGLTIVVLASTIPAAVLITVRRLSGEGVARRLAALLVIGPSAVWLAVSADAVFSTVVAWALCCLAVAATTARLPVRLAASAVAGLLFGACILLSYGLPIVAVLALGVLVSARAVRPLIVAVVLAAVAVVVLVFAALGFSWWDAYPVLRTRYYAGIASRRPASYWVWGDLAALCISAGPVLGASVALALRRSRALRRGPGAGRPIVVMTLAAALCIVLADASLMSKAEVERIWLPFVPWLLLGAALLPERWRQRALGAQVLAALAIQSLLFTTW